ncbi:MAG: guanylate kinase [Bacteroidales bacterium]|jgi:guanylate kinase|nr:guanylate kinase [Bacteroidales bacterium]
MTGKLIVISAPSGAGKTTLVKTLLAQKPNLVFSISAASRTKRMHETNKKDYYFLSVREFKNKIDNHEFLEWQEVYPNQYYGTLLSEIDRIWATGNHVVFDVDVLGGLNIKKHFGARALTIFIKPPSITHLQQRLQNRGTENDESLKKRLSKAEFELSFENRFDVVVVNDNIQTAQREIVEAIEKFLNEEMEG